MATEAVLPLNGNYGAPSNTSSQPASLKNGGADQAASAAAPPKDEVGWAFVEQYYTNMSKSPERVHLFYAKRSQFVYGVEAEKVPVSVGQRAISERISELGIEDCKVRVTNVDSQESGNCIVLQVIGEMSVKSQPHRKFVQTFILAEQPNGYYVLNDIFRYIADEPDEEEVEPVQEAAAPEATAGEPQAEIKTLSSSDNIAEQTQAAEVVDKKLEAIEADTTADAMPVIPTIPAVPAVTTEAEPAAPEPEKALEPEVTKPEVPKDPEPSPAATPVPTPAPAKEAAAPAKPAAPKTWASMLASSKAPVPVVPLQQTSQTPSKAAGSAAGVAAPAAISSPAAEPAATSAPVTIPAPSSENNEVPASPGGWQTAGPDHSKKQNRNQTAGNVNGYIRNVTPNIEANALRAALAQHGEVVYFDVSRPKNCAFVEFKTPAGYNAAVAANPHKVNGEDIVLEERKRTQNYANNFRGGMRGNRNSIDGRTPSTGGRGGFKDNRGGYVPRGRGGAAGRGRGGVGQDA